MEQSERKLLILAREETRPEFPRKIRWKSKIFGTGVKSEYLWNYYREESKHRIPFYLPYIYIEEELQYLRKSAGIARKDLRLILIDDGDARTDYVLYHIMETVNYLTILTERKEYFAGLADRAFQELGLLIELLTPWEEKRLHGNLVWDLTGQLQKNDCYPRRSICFLPHKSEWQRREMEREVPETIFLKMPCLETSRWVFGPEFAETLLVPKAFPFRQSRAQELKKWCREKKIQLVWKYQESLTLLRDSVIIP